MTININKSKVQKYKFKRYLSNEMCHIFFLIIKLKEYQLYNICKAYFAGNLFKFFVSFSSENIVAKHVTVKLIYTISTLYITWNFSADVSWNISDFFFFIEKNFRNLKMTNHFFLIQRQSNSRKMKSWYIIKYSIICHLACYFLPYMHD